MRLPIRYELEWVHDERHAPLRIARAVVQLPAGERLVGWGRSQDEQLALRCAVAELAERHALRCPGALRHAAANELPGVVVEPQRLVRHAAAQCSVRTGVALARSGARRPWLAGREFHSGRLAWLPAECVHGARCLRLPAPRLALMRPTSSGCAADGDTGVAIERASHELIERDAVARHWMAQRAACPVALPSLPPETLQRCEALQALGGQVHVGTLQQAFGPVLLVLVLSHANSFCCIGSACGDEPLPTLERALTEAEFAARTHLGRRAAVRTVRPRRLVAPADHAWLYCDPRHYRRALVLAGQGEAEDWPSLVARWPRRLQDRLAAQRAPLYWLDLTTPHTPLQVDGTPLRVVRAFIPGCVPLAFGYDALPRGMAGFPVMRAGRFPHPLA